MLGAEVEYRDPGRGSPPNVPRTPPPEIAAEFSVALGGTSDDFSILLHECLFHLHGVYVAGFKLSGRNKDCYM